MTDTEVKLMGYLHADVIAQVVVYLFVDIGKATWDQKLSKSASSKSNLDQDCILSSWMAF